MVVAVYSLCNNVVPDVKIPAKLQFQGRGGDREREK